MDKIPVTFVLTGGGHTNQALSIAGRLGAHVRPIYIIFSDDAISESKISIPGLRFRVYRSVREVRRRSFWILIHQVFLFFPAIFQSIRILQKTRSRALVACGGGPSIAPIIAGWLLKRKVIFVESISRTRSYSLVGRLSYRFFAHLFIVQWKEMLKLYPKAIWAGRLY
jgi:UDP-N-acetylglucosamine:LPS N-acetylglucosamine transferase